MLFGLCRQLARRPAVAKRVSFRRFVGTDSSVEQSEVSTTSTIPGVLPVSLRVVGSSQAACNGEFMVQPDTHNNRPCWARVSKSSAKQMLCFSNRAKRWYIATVLGNGRRIALESFTPGGQPLPVGLGRGTQGGLVVDASQEDLSVLTAPPSFAPAQAAIPPERLLVEGTKEADGVYHLQIVLHNDRNCWRRREPTPRLLCLEHGRWHIVSPRDAKKGTKWGQAVPIEPSTDTTSSEVAQVEGGGAVVIYRSVSPHRAPGDGRRVETLDAGGSA
eukprot:Hpha_TRINITY_DN34620_c0_g1::TRINITY_DN34620_c0_g1_i1::g.21035::m.21035